MLFNKTRIGFIKTLKKMGGNIQILNKRKVNNEILADLKNILPSISTGILFHGFYLGGVFYSISIGLPTGITALIVTLQPVLTNALAGPMLNEKITWKQLRENVCKISLDTEKQHE